MRSPRCISRDVLQRRRLAPRRGHPRRVGHQKLYVDGTLVGSSATATSATFTGFWRVGGGNLGGWPDAPSSSYFNGDDRRVRDLRDGTVGLDTIAATVRLGVNDVTGAERARRRHRPALGQHRALSLEASTDNVGIDGYRVYRGLTAGFTPDAGSLVATTSGTTFSQSPAAGTYYYKVVAFDWRGNASARLRGRLGRPCPTPPPRRRR